VSKEIVYTEAAPAPFQGAPYNQAIVAGGFVFVAGQVGFQPGTGEMVEGGIGPQTDQALSNMRAILEAAGSSMDKIVKTTVFLSSFDDFAGMNEVYAGRIGDRPPARSTIEAGRLPAGALVEIEAIAVA
jgi:2-iminobutanoate/2-iminopropanoate deaminase